MPAPCPDGLVLSGELTPADIGTVIAVIAVYNDHITPSGVENYHRGSL